MKTALYTDGPARIPDLEHPMFAFTVPHIFIYLQIWLFNDYFRIISRFIISIFFSSTHEIKVSSTNTMNYYEEIIAYVDAVTAITYNIVWWHSAISWIFSSPFSSSSLRYSIWKCVTLSVRHRATASGKVTGGQNP